MESEALALSGAWRFDPIVRLDERGSFLESLTEASLEAATGRLLRVAQVNTSFSVKGTIRGVHFALVPPSQAKYVQCVSGAVQDVVVDTRIGSPTYGEWVSVLLDDRRRSSLFISEGLGHAFCALSETATVVYLCSTPFTPEREFGVNPLDPDLNLPWPQELDVVVSAKDAAAPTLAEAAEQGLLPDYYDCLAWYETARMPT